VGLRFASGAVLAASTLAALWFGGLAFAALIAVAVFMAWGEWFRLVHQFPGILPGQSGRALWPGLSLAAASALPAVGWAAGGFLLMGVVAMAQVASATSAKCGLWLALGALYVAMPGLAMVWLRDRPITGFELVLWLFVVIWASDSLAYGLGHWIGGPKLAPRISPGKTWAGLGGAVLGAVIAGVGLGVSLGVGLGFFASENQLAVLGLGAAALGLVGQVGDLLESAIKRRAGVKDSGRLIPGHGGILDRLDSTLAAAPLMALIVWLGENLR
jgi:phosphatidate cytidylyltransferase